MGILPTPPPPPHSKLLRKHFLSLSPPDFFSPVSFLDKKSHAPYGSFERGADWSDADAAISPALIGSVASFREGAYHHYPQCVMRKNWGKKILSGDERNTKKRGGGMNIVVVVYRRRRS